MITYSNKNSENFPRKCFWWKEKETRVKIQPWVSAKRPSNNSALGVERQSGVKFLVLGNNATGEAWGVDHSGTHTSFYICIKLHSLRSCKVALHQPEIPSQPGKIPEDLIGLIAIQYLRIYLRLKWLLWSTVDRQRLIFPTLVTCHSFLSNSFCLLVCLFFIFRLNESCF